MNGLLEILTTKKWMIAPSHITAIRQALQHNLNTHAAFAAEKKVMGRMYDKDGDMVKSFCIGEDGEYAGSSWVADEIKVPFVNVLDVNGPITRNGGGCSYGSVDHRDMMMTAAENPNCRGHIFVINTPGGSAWAKNDYEQAINYARSKGQPVLAFIDGMCASAGMYLASLCDERYYMNPQDEIGCIGVMAAFYTEKDGSKNEYTNETYHELYDPESVEKNKWVRDIANNDDDKLLIEELAALGREFRADVKKACPTATSKHLKGRIFPAHEVKGILVDDQSTLADCIARAFGLSDGSLKAIERPAATIEEEEKTTDDKASETKINTTMEKKFENLAAACGVEELIVTEEGTHLDVSLVETLDNKLAEDAKTLAEKEELVATMQSQLDKQNESNNIALEGQKESLVAEHNKAIEDLKAEHAKAIEELKAENEKVVADLKEQHSNDIEEANKAREDVEKELEGAKEALTTAEQTIADRDAQIKALTEKPADTPDNSPANNGAGAEEAVINTMPAYDTNLSPEENERIRNEWKAKHVG